MIKNAFLLMLVFTLLFGGAYPLTLFLIGRIFFPFQAGGSLLFYPERQTLVGSPLIGQHFTSSRYFHLRPSLTPDEEYNAASSSGSQRGPASPALLQEISTRAELYRLTNLLTADTCIPIDAVTASASGLDPHISITNALLQVARVASERGISEEEVNDLVQKYTERPFFGLLGEIRVNVLMLNLALDQAYVQKE
jgi:K+-transporting ATPase ATPase C chain